MSSNTAAAAAFISPAKLNGCSPGDITIPNGLQPVNRSLSTSGYPRSVTGGTQAPDIVARARALGTCWARAKWEAVEARGSIPHWTYTRWSFVRYVAAMAPEASCCWLDLAQVAWDAGAAEYKSRHAARAS